MKILRGIFQGDALLPLIFVIAMMPFNNIFRKCTEDYKFIKSQEKIHHFMSMDDIKLFAKKWKGIEDSDTTIRTYGQDIRMEFGKEICQTNNEKWKKRGNGRNTTGKSRKNRDVWREGKLRILGNIGSRQEKMKETK